MLKKRLLIAGIILSGILLVGCGKSQTNSADTTASQSKQSKKVIKSFITLDKSTVTASSRNTFTVTGKTTSKTDMYLLDSKGMLVDTLTSNAKGNFKVSENAPSKEQDFTLTTDPSTEMGSKGNDISKLKTKAKFKVLPNDTFSKSEHSASIADKNAENSLGDEEASEKESVANSMSQPSSEKSSTKTTSTKANGTSNATTAYRKSIREFATNSTEYGISSVKFTNKEVHYYVAGSYAAASDSEKKALGTYLFNHTTKIGDLCDIPVQPIYVYTSDGTLIARSTLTGGIKAE